MVKSQISLVHITEFLPTCTIKIASYAYYAGKSDFVDLKPKKLSRNICSTLHELEGLGVLARLLMNSCTLQHEQGDLSRFS